MKNTVKKGLCMLLAAGVVLTGCTSKPALLKSDLVTDYVKEAGVERMTSEKESLSGRARFEMAWPLFTEILTEAEKKGEDNVLISPASALMALGMTMKGARGNTLSECEAFLLGGQDREAFHEEMAGTLSYWEKGKAVRSAQSVWLNTQMFQEAPGEVLEKDFVTEVGRYYGAGLLGVPFNEEGLDLINRWVAKETKDRIPKVLDSFSADSVMVLLNAMTFDGKWEEAFKDTQKTSFTDQEGKVTQVPMMYGEAEVYLEFDGVCGFKKDYEGGTYSFIALLPPKGQDLAAMIKELDAGRLNKIVNTLPSVSCRVGVPEFTFQDQRSFNEALQALGVKEAFDSQKADFSGIRQANDLYIARILQSCMIEVDKEGTKAAASTAVEMATKGVEIRREVILDRPFIYMIYDNSRRLPLFMGAYQKGITG